MIFYFLLWILIITIFDNLFNVNLYEGNFYHWAKKTNSQACPFTFYFFYFFVCFRRLRRKLFWSFFFSTKIFVCFSYLLLRFSNYVCDFTNENGVSFVLLTFSHVFLRPCFTRLLSIVCKESDDVGFVFQSLKKNLLLSQSLNSTLRLLV